GARGRQRAARSRGPLVRPHARVGLRTEDATRDSAFRRALPRTHASRPARAAAESRRVIAQPAVAPDHTVAIIGAGLSGIGMAAALRRAGIEDFVILERAGDVGGTWRDNTSPGVGVDIPAFAYQFSYELKPDWSRLF